MKKITETLLAALIAVLLVFSFVSCGDKAATTATGVTASYTADTELGQGEKTLTVEVVTGDKTVKFTIHTDKTTVGMALLANNLIAGDVGEFGMYVKVVNGVTADYDVDQSYWAFYIDGELATTGVDTTDIDEGSVYRLVYTK